MYKYDNNYDGYDKNICSEIIDDKGNNIYMTDEEFIKFKKSLGIIPNPKIDFSIKQIPTSNHRETYTKIASNFTKYHRVDYNSKVKNGINQYEETINLLKHFLYGHKYWLYREVKIKTKPYIIFYDFEGDLKNSIYALINTFNFRRDKYGNVLNTTEFNQELAARVKSYYDVMYNNIKTKENNVYDQYDPFFNYYIMEVDFFNKCISDKIFLYDKSSINNRYKDLIIKRKNIKNNIKKLEALLLLDKITDF